MSDQPKTIAAVIEYIRYRANNYRHDGWESVADELEDLADRIEAAVERERDEDRQLAAIAESDEAFARCARCDRPERSPGNAAATREALERIDKRCRKELEEPINESDPTGGLAMCNILAIANAALSAPARNCDVGTVDEQTKRFLSVCRDRKHFHDVRKCPLFVGPNCFPIGCVLRWSQMPFALAEGGAK